MQLSCYVLCTCTVEPHNKPQGTQCTLNGKIFANSKFLESAPYLVGRKFATKSFMSLTIHCIYLYFGMCAGIFTTKEFASEVNSRKLRILLVAKIFQFRVYSSLYQKLAIDSGRFIQHYSLAHMYMPVYNNKFTVTEFFITGFHCVYNIRRNNRKED